MGQTIIKGYLKDEKICFFKTLISSYIRQLIFSDIEGRELLAHIQKPLTSNQRATYQFLLYTFESQSKLSFGKGIFQKLAQLNLVLALNLINCFS